MSVREYIGARYVPLFADPLEWDATKTYEPLTVVLYQGNSFTSRQAVPANIPITNTAYWAQTGNYNAQVEQYRQEVQTYSGRISGLEESLPSTDFDSTNTVKQYIDDSIDELADVIPSTDFDSTNTVKKYIDDSVDDLSDIIPSANFDSTNTVKKYIDDSVDELADIIPSTEFDDTNTIKKYIDDVGAVIPSSDFSSVNTVKNYIDAKTGKGGYTGANVLCITDSWGSENVRDISKCWMRIVCESIGANYIDLSQGATGYIKAPTFLTRVQTYVQNNPTMVPKINMILISGGINDSAYGSSVADIVTAMDNTMNYLVSTFTNATIYHIPQISGIDMSKCSIANANRNNWVDAALPSYECKNARHSWVSKCVFVSSMQYALTGGDATLFNSQDYVHPTQAGMNRLATVFLGAVFGNSRFYNTIYQDTLGVVHVTGGSAGDVNLNPVLVNTSVILYSDGILKSVIRFADNTPPLMSAFNVVRMEIPYVWPIDISGAARTNGIGAVISKSNAAINAVRNIVKNGYYSNGSPNSASFNTFEYDIEVYPVMSDGAVQSAIVVSMYSEAPLIH